jgi:Tfp pilus assembly protein PilV
MVGAEALVAVFVVVMLLLAATAFLTLHRQSLRFVFDKESRRLTLESWRRRRQKR